MAGVKRTLNPATKVQNNPVICPDRPWEGNNLHYGCVFYDEVQGLFRDVVYGVDCNAFKNRSAVYTAGRRINRSTFGTGKNQTALSRLSVTPLDRWL